MLSSKIEDKIAQLFLNIGKGEKEIQKIKKILTEKYKINPIKLFNKIDVDEKGFFTKVDFESYLNNFKVTFSKNDIDIFFFFYDSNLDNYINLEEFIDFLIPNNTINNEWKNKIKKNKIDYNDYFIESEILNLFLQIFKEEKVFGENIFQIINEIKSTEDFSVQLLFNILRGYLYITIESLSAFFDRKHIKYKKSDVENILNRIHRGNSCKISLNRLESLFYFSNNFYPNNNQLTNSNCNNQSNDNYYIRTTTVTDNSNNYKTLYNESSKNNYYRKKNSIPKSRNQLYSNHENLINKYLNTEKNSGKEFNNIYECIHLSTNNVRIPIKINHKPPIFKKRINNGSNILYKNYIQEKRNNSLNHRRCQTLENKPNYVINSYSEKKINKIPNSSSINNYYKNNISYEMNECKYFPTEYSINSNYYYNQNIFKNNTYNNIPVRVSDSLVIKPAFERRNCK